MINMYFYVSTTYHDIDISDIVRKFAISRRWICTDVRHMTRFGGGCNEYETNITNEIDAEIEAFALWQHVIDGTSSSHRARRFNINWRIEFCPQPLGPSGRSKDGTRAFFLDNEDEWLIKKGSEYLLHRITGPTLRTGQYYLFGKRIEGWDINKINQNNWTEFYTSRDPVESAMILLELDRVGKISIDKVTKQNWLMLF